METEDRQALLEKAVKVGAELFEALGVVGSSEGPLLPAVLRKRTETGALEEKPIMIMTLDEPRRYKARVKSREWAIRLKLDLERDKDLVSQLENYELLAYAIREPKGPTYDQVYAKGEELFAAWKKGPLMEIWGLVNHWEDINNPRFGELTRDELWDVVQRIHREKTLRPLMLTAGIEQASCIMLMAEAALSSPMAPSSLRLRSSSESPSSSTAKATEDDSES
jgi:hypothetical protein